jgi:hypothetical protein
MEEIYFVVTISARPPRRLGLTLVGVAVGAGAGGPCAPACWPARSTPSRASARSDSTVVTATVGVTPDVVPPAPQILLEHRALVFGVPVPPLTPISLSGRGQERVFPFIGIRTKVGFVDLYGAACFLPTLEPPVGFVAESAFAPDPLRAPSLRGSHVHYRLWIQPLESSAAKGFQTDRTVRVPNARRPTEVGRREMIAAGLRRQRWTNTGYPRQRIDQPPKPGSDWQARAAVDPFSACTHQLFAR